MEAILLKAKEKAIREQFLKDVDTPEKLKRYFLEKYINPLKETISNINPNFFEIYQGGEPRTSIRFLENNLYIVVHDTRVKFIDNEEKSFNVDFRNKIPRVYQGDEQVPLNELHLKSIVDIFVSY